MRSDYTTVNVEISMDGPMGMARNLQPILEPERSVLRSKKHSDLCHMYDLAGRVIESKTT